MKIGQSPDKAMLPPVLPGATPGTAAAAAAAAALAANAPARSADEAGAQLKLSSTAATLLSSSPNAEFDAGKVAQISDAIDKGTFRINPEAIADKLIANAQELLTQAKS